MDYPEKDIYSELVARLKSKATYFTDLGHPAPEHYDMDRQQYEYEEEKKDIPFLRPAIFFMFDDVLYKPRGSNSKQGTVPLIVTTVQDKYVDSADGAYTQDDYLKILEWKYLVNNVLEYFTGTCFTSLNLVKIQTDHANKNLHVERLHYELTVVLMRKQVP